MDVDGFPLSPLPPEGGECPRCALTLGCLRLRPAGWRFAIEGTCGGCGHQYLQDLPSGHALIYPACLDLDSGETFQRGEGRWFGDWLLPTYERPDFDPVGLRVEQRTHPERVSILNCLDQIYGHSLLKLLNAPAAGELSERGLIVLIPRALRSLAPSDAAEVWIVDETSARCGRWLTDLERQLSAEIERFSDCVLFPARPHPNPSRIDLARLLPDEPPERPGNVSIVLSLRDDRTWGGGRVVEDRNLGCLIEGLKTEFPGAGLTAIGLGQPDARIDALDLRSQTPDEACERRWLRVLRGADITIGVHGSNMLLPSALSTITLELLPHSRFGNAFQATLTTDDEPVAALIRHRTLYGDEALGDISPDRVLSVATAALREHRRAVMLLAGVPPSASAQWIPLESGSGSRASDPTRPPPLSQRIRNAAAVRTRLNVAKGRASRVGSSLRARATRLPAVRLDSRGNLFELEHVEEVEAFESHGGHFEAAEIDLVSAFLAPGMTAVDVGANLGAFTVAMSRSVGSRGVVHAFEPDPGSRGRLARTLHLNRLSNVKVFDQAIGEADGNTTFFQYAGSDASWSGMNPREVHDGVRLIKPSRRITVEVTKLESHCDTTGIEHIDALKVDTEGADAAALRGAESLLRAERIDFVMVEVSDETLVPMGDTAHGLVSFLEAAGMRTFALEGGALVPRRIAGAQRTLLNVIALNESGLLRAADLGLLG